MTKRISGLAVCCFCLAACAVDATPDPSPSAPTAPRSADHITLPSAAVAATPEPPKRLESPVVLPSDLPKINVPAYTWGFEPASADCNGWSTIGGEAIRASPARSGSYSCKVCADGSLQSISLTHDVGALAAGHYVFTVYVSKRVSTAAPPQANARIEADTSVGPRAAFTQTVSVREDWDRLETPIDLAADATALRVTIGAPLADVDRCLFIDDVTITRVE